jgi:hypothetical protein
MSREFWIKRRTELSTVKQEGEEMTKAGFSFGRFLQATAIDARVIRKSAFSNVPVEAALDADFGS